MKTGAELIVEERKRQIEVEGYIQEHDLSHDVSEFLDAAVSYITPNHKRPTLDVTNTLDRQPSYAVICDRVGINGKVYKLRILPPSIWPWGEQYWKPSPKDRIRELVKAAALIAAAIDVLQTEKGE